MTRVDLIVPTFNGSDLLRRCLKSLRASTFTDVNVIVYDDGSQEDISGLVHRELPIARVMRSDQNVGLARAFNSAIRAGNSEYVVLLNNDTEVQPDWLGALVSCADRHPGAASVASKMLLMSDRRRLHSAGDYFSVRGVAGNRGVWMEDLGQYDVEEPVFGACGGAALYRRDALESTTLPGGDIFDSRLFMYLEDVDLAWRLQLAGYSCMYCPDACVYHALSATGGGSLASYYVARNIWLVLARSVPRGVLRRHRARVAAHHAGRVATSLRHLREPAARASLRGTLVGLILAAMSRRHAPDLDPANRARVETLLFHR